MDFKVFKAAIAKQFGVMSKGDLFRTGVEKDALWAGYLAAFPAGTNPVFRERTEHDCNCCKNFIRAVGNVAAIVNGQVVSIWDAEVSDPNYQIVADALAKLVKAAPIVSTFLHFEGSAGTDKTLVDTLNGVSSFSHFHVNLPRQFVMKGAEIPTALGEARANHDVLSRSLDTITDDAVSTVLDLIAQNTLYRGAEHKSLVLSFRDLKAQYDQVPAAERDNFAWLHSKASGAVCKIRNTVIGTLLVDLSEGKDIEQAVAAFESKVAPANYKRPTALVTKAMIEQAKAKVAELGLGSALERRYATIEDITVNNILFANRDARRSMSADVFDILTEKVAAKPKSLDKVEDVAIATFIADILPRVESMEIMVENRHQSNLVSLIAPVDPTAKRLFKWENPFSWSYNGEVADSELRKQVQARGGSVSGVFRFSHQWNYDKRNASLMDLHVFMPGNSVLPDNGVHDRYGNTERVGWNHRAHARSGGVQDVDYVQEAPEGYVPVENITFPSLARMPDGTYICKVHNWHLRSPTQGGFRAEIEFGGTVYQYEVDRPLKNKEWVTVAEVTLKGGVFTIKHHLSTEAASKQVWGVTTQTFRPVNVLMLSPNFWDGRGVGNQHWFFMLDGCRNDGQARGFFNEFLTEELTAHRKVIEMVGSRMKTEQSDRQLSGLGFSSTQRNSVLCRVTGSFQRVINLVF